MLGGCASFPDLVKQKPAVVEAMPGMSPEELQQALRVNREILSSGREASRDRTLYEIGLILSHPDNPERDLAAAIEGFRQVSGGFPESGLQKHAGMWALILKELEEERIARGTLKERNDRLENRMGEREKTIRSLEARMDGLQNELKGLKAEKKRAQNRIQELESENQQIREQLEKMKEIDLGIQEKKTEVLHK